MSNSDAYSKLSSEERYSLLEDDDNHAEYMSGLLPWESARRQGQRRARKRATSVAAVSESGLETKQILGYLWPVALLKDHGKPVPKKLQSVPHMGKQVRGAVLKEWAIGCIEVSTNSSKKARQSVSVADSEDADGPDPCLAFSSLEKSVNVASSAAASDGQDIVLSKSKAKGGADSDDDLAAILWGDNNIGGTADRTAAKPNP